MTVELVMPKMGESITEASILRWLKNPGDKIEQDESLLEVATDKVDTEVPSTHGGILKEILAKEGEVVKVGKPIAVIETENSNNVVTPTPQSEQKPAIAEPVAAEVAEPSKPSRTISNGSQKQSVVKETGRFYSPLVRNIAREENIAIAELETIPGSGAEGRVTKKDILSYLQNRKLGASISVAPQRVPVSIGAGDEIIQMDRMRKMIAERMVDSKRISPHVTSFVEADVTGIVYWRNKWKHEFPGQAGDALTCTPVFIEAV